MKGDCKERGLKKAPGFDAKQFLIIFSIHIPHQNWKNISNTIYFLFPNYADVVNASMK